MECISAGSELIPPAAVEKRGGWCIQSHLVMLMMAALVPMIIFSAVMIMLNIQQARDTRSQLLENMASEAAQRVDNQLRHTVRGLQAIGQAEALGNDDLQAFHALADRLVKAEHWDHIALFGSAGEHFVNTRKPFGVALAPLNRPDLPMEAARSRRPLVSDMTSSLQALDGEGPDRYLTVIYVPVVQRQGVKYVIAVAIEPDRWLKLIQDEMGKGEGMQALLLDRQSRIIASTAPNGAGPGVGRIQAVVPDAGKDEEASSSVTVHTIDGREAYVASHKADFAGWTVLTFAPAKTFDSPLGKTIMAMAGGFVLLLLIGLWLALLLGRRTAHSISQLVASVRAVAAGGAPVPIKSNVAEVTQASQSVNETAALLAARRCELEAANHAKNAFLAMLGHELRNPLAPIRNGVQLMKKAEPGSDVARWAVGVIDRQSAHLARLVDDLLDVTRIDQGKIELQKEVVDLRQLLQGAALDAQGVLEQAGLLLTLDLPSEPLLVNCDRIRLAQMVGNLLHNATKFTPRGGRLMIRLAQKDALAIIEVSDNGFGIAPDHLEKIFELFAQEQPSGTGGNTGLGIGLALTRKLVKLHGGTICATSAGRGQGSTFRIELPAGIAAPEDDGDAAAPLSNTSGAGTRVLVVDDNQDSADTLRDLLDLSGFASTVAYSGQAALLAVQRERPDAVLLDIGLPDIDGYEVCRRIRGGAATRPPVLIAVTGWGQDKDRDSAMAAGFDAHLTKPADADRVIAILKSLKRHERSGSDPVSTSADASLAGVCPPQRLARH